MSVDQEQGPKSSDVATKGMHQQVFSHRVGHSKCAYELMCVKLYKMTGPVLDYNVHLCGLGIVRSHLV